LRLTSGKEAHAVIKAFDVMLLSTDRAGEDVVVVWPRPAARRALWQGTGPDVWLALRVEHIGDRSWECTCWVEVWSKRLHTA